MKILVCGYLGYIGYPLTMRLLMKGHKVIGVDNKTRERNVKNLNSASVTGDNSEKEFDKGLDLDEYSLDISNPGDVNYLISSEKPDIVVNLAHIPSGPYSMISRETAHETILTNTIGTNNMLWAIKEHVPNCHYITIGTTGEYDHNSNIDIEEGTFKMVHNGRESEEMIFPRRPGSIYHSSKVGSTYLIDYLAKAWNLRCTDVMQAVVFGLYTDECDAIKTFTRFDSDEAFGTVINRFCVQACTGVPLTIYGDGDHQRGFLSLNDCMQALMIAIDNPAEMGKVQTWNQLSEWHSMNDIAGMVQEVYYQKFYGIIKEQHIPTPRVEKTDKHYYNYVTKKLKALGYVPTRTIKQEIEYVINKIEPIINADDALKEKLRLAAYPKILFNNEEKKHD